MNGATMEPAAVLSAAAYFDTVRRAYEAVVMPPAFKSPARRIDASPTDIEAKFVAANPKFRDSFRTACGAGALSEVRVCMGKDLSPRACGPRDAECTAQRIGMLPVQ